MMAKRTTRTIGGFTIDTSVNDERACIMLSGEGGIFEGIRAGKRFMECINEIIDAYITDEDDRNTFDEAFDRAHKNMRKGGTVDSKFIGLYGTKARIHIDDNKTVVKFYNTKIGDDIDSEDINIEDIFSDKSIFGDYE